MMNDTGMMVSNIASLGIKSVIDIGGFYGTFSNELNQATPIESIIFEANPNCEPMLSEQKFPYIMTGLSNTKETKELYLRIDGNGDPWVTCTGASFYLEKTPAYKDYYTVPIKTSLLDDYDLYPEGVDLIKIDVQGSELDVIDGGIDTIKRAKYCLLECSLANYNQEAPKTSDIIQKMNSIGFYVHSIVDTHIGDPDQVIDGKVYGEKVLQIDILFSSDISENTSMLDIIKYQEQIIY